MSIRLPVLLFATLITITGVNLNSIADDKPLASCSVPIHSITQHDVTAAQKQWADGLLAIGKAYRDHKNYTAVAHNLILKLYAYNIDNGIVLFKPTKAQDIPFRQTVTGALSYFVGNNPQFKEDKGFALNPWSKISFHNQGMYFHNDIAIAVGEYYFTTQAHNTTKVEYTFGYVKDSTGHIKIFLQHSSLPYQK